MDSRVDRIRDALVAYEPKCIYLFGSWARKEADELSDVDVVVIKETDVPFFDRLLEASRLLPLEVGAVDLLVYTPEEFRAMRRDGNAFAEMIAEEAILIYGQEPEI